MRVRKRVFSCTDNNQTAFDGTNNQLYEYRAIFALVSRVIRTVLKVELDNKVQYSIIQ